MLPGGTGAQSAVQRTMAAYHARVLAMEAEQMREMARRWLGVEASLEARISALSMEIAVAQLKGEKVSAARLYQMEHYQALLQQARSEIQGYNQWAADLISQRQAEMARLGILGTEAAIEESYREAGVVKTSYHRLPVEAVEKMIGMAGDGSPLSELFKTSYPETMLALTQALVDATAQGDNPRETARRMTDAMAGNLQRALVIARTEQLRAFRMASLESMKESGVVEGWIWRSALQDRTCAACLAMDGTLHSFDEQLDDHPQGRCWMQPKIKGLEPVAQESGKDWFERQDEATQRSILGSARYEAWKEGKFDFSQLAGRRHSEEWGTTVKVSSLEELISRSDVVSGTTINHVRLTSEREAHWRIKHPETINVEKSLLRNAIEKPTLVQPSKSDPLAKINYIQDENGKWWAVVIAYPIDAQPFVLTFRRAHGPGK